MNGIKLKLMIIVLSSIVALMALGQSSEKSMTRDDMRFLVIENIIRELRTNGASPEEYFIIGIYDDGKGRSNRLRLLLANQNVTDNSISTKTNSTLNGLRIVMFPESEIYDVSGDGNTQYDLKSDLEWLYYITDSDATLGFFHRWNESLFPDLKIRLKIRPSKLRPFITTMDKP